MTVELRHLRAFLAIVDCGTISRAAEHLHISQPALSRTLAQLERSLGVSLLDRSTHHSKPTDAGQTFAASAREVVRSFDLAVQQAAGAVAPLRFGQSWGTATHAAAIVRMWNAEHPDQPLSPRHSDERMAGLLTGQTDVALVRTPAVDRSLRWTVIDHEPRIAAVPATHRLAVAALIGLDDLVHERLIVNTVAGTTTLDLWPEAGRPAIAMDAATIDDWLMAIATGTGVGVTAASTATLHPHPDVRYVAIGDAPPVSLLLAWPQRGAHPQTKSFVASARRATRHLRAGGPS